VKYVEQAFHDIARWLPIFDMSVEAGFLSSQVNVPGFQEEEFNAATVCVTLRRTGINAHHLTSLMTARKVSMNGFFVGCTHLQHPDFGRFFHGN